MVEIKRRQKEIFTKGLSSGDPAASNVVYLSSGSMDKSYVYCADTGTTESRAINRRLYIQGTGGYGETLRVLTVVENVAAGSGGVHGAHIGLDFSTSGSCTGQGIALRATLMPGAKDYGATNVTYSALQAEIYFPASCDLDSATRVSVMRMVIDGNSTASGKFDGKGYLIDFQGFTVGTGNIIAAKSSAAVSHTARCLIGSTEYWIMLSNAQ